VSSHPEVEPEVTPEDLAEPRVSPTPVEPNDRTPIVSINGEDVVAQIWRVDIGRVPLYLLDAERPENSRLARWTLEPGRLTYTWTTSRPSRSPVLVTGTRTSMPAAVAVAVAWP